MQGKSKAAVLLVVFMVLALLGGTCARFADDETRAKLYGWLPGGDAPVDRGSTRRPDG